MIIEGKKNTAFDLLEAAMTLSDVYHKNNAQKSISIDFFGETEHFCIYLFDDTKKKGSKITSHWHMPLNEETYGYTFEEAFEIIEKELAQYE